jgi:lipopolysaccharide heptosyltransferase II
MSPNLNAWKQAERLLCVRLDAMGDVLMTTPAFRALKESHPSRQVTLLTSPSGADVARLCPYVDDIVIYQAPWMPCSQKSGSPAQDSAVDIAMVDELRARNFDAAIIFTVYSQSPLPSAMLCYLAEVPLRLAHCRENPYRLLTDWVKDQETEYNFKHEVRRQLDLIDVIGARTAEERLTLRISENATKRVRSLLTGQGLELEQPWIVVHPGATAASRRYPPDRFARAVRSLIERHGFQVVFSGSLEERDLVERVRSLVGTNAVALAGRLNFEEFAALLRLAPLLISNNTGAVHVAAATGTPIVDLYALTNPQHTPWAVPHRVLSHEVPCKYCYKSVCPEGHNNCLALVEPDTRRL